MNQFFSILLLFFISCTQTPVAQDPTPVNLDRTFQTAGVEQFFLPELPTWRQYSQNGECYLNQTKVNLDFSRLHSTYQLTLNQLIELQVQFFERMNVVGKERKMSRLNPREEAQFFYETLEKVRAGVKRIKLPNDLQVKFVWKESKLPIKFNPNDVLVSLCSSTHEIEDWLEKNYPGLEHPYALGFEALSVYNESFLLQPKESFLWSGLFDTQVKLVTSHLYLPIEFGGGIIYQR
jgi:hypothetical protein